MCINFVKCIQFIQLVLSVGFFFSIPCASDKSITKESSPEKHPYVVLVRITHDDCSGAIIHSRWVISSAQCFKENFEKSFALAGQDHYGAQIDLGKNGQGKELIHLYKHPQANGLKKDMMLCQTNETWKFNLLVQYVSIYIDDSLDTAKNCKGIGFGDSREDIKMYERHVSNIKKCTHGRETSLLCTTNMKTVGQCDIGGPLVCSNKRLYGIITNETTGGNNEGYFSFLPPNINWIRSFITDLPGFEERESGGIILQPSFILLLTIFWVILFIS